MRLLLVFAFYTITRFLFYLFNQSLFTDIDAMYLMELMWRGIRFDASAIAYTNILVILMHIIPFKFRYNAGYQKAVSIVYYVVNTVAITLNMGDIAYYPFTLRRTTTGVFQEFENESASDFIHFIWDYWYVSFIVVVFVILLIWVNKRIKVQRASLRLNNYLYVLVGMLLMGFVSLFTVGAMRGGFTKGLRPINIVSAGQHIRKPEHRAIILNTPFALIRTIGTNRLPRKDYYDDVEQNRYLM